ncbi:DsbA family protein [Carnobacterium viridans]|uniref:Thioredoxin n=1 Tax=Carnobacterium viridans TaxID=174587 RepID=A0A1H1B2E1_9LACT|nr:DsbA family protein [Carnobacterium viridans]UDE95963.1 DsbA family protein [Carnobacterium viridans]SDQ46077.1 Thioredoxin [Carnobacterium viridans]
MVDRTKQIEIFLFINPISKASLKMEEEVLKFVNAYEENTQITIYPYHNTQTLYRYMKKNDLSTEMAVWNKLYNESFHLSLAFIAATIQGKKKGREFLLAIQRKMIIQKRALSKELLIESAEQVDLDMEMFLFDFHSPFVQHLFDLDQVASCATGATDTPSCLLVITGEEKKATLIERFVTAEDLYQMV